jgi:nucleotide-binding universal stress UspA family protein
MIHRWSFIPWRCSETAHVQDILTYCTDIRSWSPGARYAAELAAALDASLTGIHVTPSLPPRTPEGMPASISAELIAYAQDEVQGAMLAGPRFASWARQFGVEKTQWQVALGDAGDALGVAANWSDIIVFARENSEAARSIELISETLLSGFACVVVPEATYAIGRLDRIAVVYDGSRASIRALHQAIPLLQKATHVVVLRGKWPAERTAAFIAFDPRLHLEKHGVASEVEEVDADADQAGDALLEAASRRRVDLVVAGAAGKNRFGDIHLDPIPRYLLQYANLPLYLKA